MCTKNTYRRGRRIAAGLAACALAFGAASATGGGLAEQGPDAPQLLEAHVAMLDTADLEQAFWICDHAATTRGMDGVPADFCAAIYDELKIRKFGGDFEQLLMWWRQNKPAEHDKLASH